MNNNNNYNFNNNNNYNTKNIKKNKIKLPKKIKGVNSTIILILLGVLAIALIIGIYFLYKKVSNQLYSSNPMWISKPVDAFKLTDDMKTGYVVPATANPLNFSYSTWIYISNWNYNLSKHKTIFSRSNEQGKSHEPSLFLLPNVNTLHAVIRTTEGSPESCEVRNIPLQKWVNICYVLNNRNVDIYINGRLERSCVLKGIPVINSNHKVYPLGANKTVTSPGFYGQMSRFQYIAHALTPDEVVSIYSSGPF
tara:strand:+ start:1856 stop:2608 length:753 start_codon:yes stop_codon:yes gene_type:complete